MWGYNMDKLKQYYKFKEELRMCKDNLDLYRFLCKMLIEIWWNTRDGYRDGN